MRGLKKKILSLKSLIISDKKIKFCFVFMIVFFFLFSGSVMAKYLIQRHQLYLYDASDFYFESDLLSDNTNQKSYSYKKGIDYIEVSIVNNIDKLRYSNVKIFYTVKITDISGNEVIDKNGDEVLDVSGVLEKGLIDSDIVKFENLSGGTYVVTAFSDKPYKKQISAIFNLTDSNRSINYKVSDAKDSPVLNLTVSTYDYAGNVTVSWPEGVAPDSTDSNFSSVDSGYSSGNVDVLFKANSEYIFQFFKQDSLKVYSDSDFSVEESD